jgi:phosphoribosyl-dephospho-CoA transferase
MFHCEPHSVRTHDLLELDANQLFSGHAPAPEWVEECLLRSPFVVVRRGLTTEQEIPVGVRGADRSQRWAAFCHPKSVRCILTPPQLLRRTAPTARANATPALRALIVIKDRWLDFNRPWGPGGSVGFELATGRHVVTPQSDLDIVLYAERRMTAEEAKSICDRAMDLPAIVDIRVETPVCGFSLMEYARAESTGILLRTPNRHVLGNDPWSDELKMGDVGQAVGNRLSAL